MIAPPPDERDGAAWPAFPLSGLPRVDTLIPTTPGKSVQITRVSHRPSLSVIVPLHNRRRYLRQAVESLLQEKIEGIEIIVVDDASSDGSLDEIRGLPVQAIRLDRNAGVAAARNIGIRRAQGEVIGFLDSDDILVQGGLRSRLEALAGNGAIQAVGGCIAGVIDENGDPLGSAEEVIFRHEVSPPKFLTWDFFQKGGFFPGALWLYLFRRRFLEKVGPMDERLKVADDWDFLLRALRLGPIPILTSSVAYYRVHGSQLSKVVSGDGVHWNRKAMAEWMLVGRGHGII